MALLKNGFKNASTIFKIMYLFKVVMILALCRVHDFTRYKVCRSLTDLFYWPEGLCIDMLVVFCVLLLCLLIFYDYYMLVKYAQKEYRNTTQHK